MFTYKELLYIKAVSQEKSISKAAEKLYISQPSLSQAIIQIEKRLGEKILLRSKDGIKLTYLGERYLKMANDIVNIYADFNNDITKINDLKMGEIKIGITRFMGMYLLPHILPEFSKMYPNIQIYIEEEESRILEKKLLNMSIDFAIMHMNPLNINTKLSYEKLCEDRFIIVSKKNSNISKFAIDKNEEFKYINLKNLKDEKFVLLKKTQGIRQSCDIMFASEEIKPNICLTTKNFETARRLASGGYALTIIPKQYLKIFNTPYDSDYYFIDNRYNYWYSCILTNKENYLSQISQQLLKKVRKLYQDNYSI